MRQWISLKPRLVARGKAQAVLLDCARALARIKEPLTSGAGDVRDVRDRFLEEALTGGTQTQPVRVLVAALCDLRAQGWDLRVRSSVISFRKPSVHENPADEKNRIRLGLLVERDRQLREPSVRRFVADMERRRLGPNGWASIFSLMRDGVELAGRLRSAAALQPNDRERTLATIIQPYLQCVDDSVCPWTGIPLKQIWRYFRHTWVTPHNTIPGRNVWFLIRDAAVEPNPVIGIAALGSACVQMSVRDDWIGWSREPFLHELRRNPSNEWAMWLNESLKALIAGVYMKDFCANDVMTTAHLRNPDVDVIARLRAVAARARTKHRRFGSSSEHKSQPTSAICWESRAITPLFTWKRAETLAELLEARLHLQESGFSRATGSNLAKVLGTATGRRAIGRILRRVKGSRVGHDLLDLTVCGAVAPYSDLLGGKLVALLTASPEMRRCYEQRYGGSPSIIASSMAGKAVTTMPRLVLLGTTSLYGIGSSQYNRLRLPAAHFRRDATGEVRFIKLGITEGYGTFHFSKSTLREVRMLVAQRDDGRPVRYIFGEGVNPRLREMRGALEDVGLPSDDLMQHGTPRIVYGVPLAKNTRDVLLGRAREPDYILPHGDPERVTQEIARYWIKRWLVRRVEQGDVLNRVSGNTLSYPITHGARVPLPVLSDDMMLPLDI